MKSLQRSIFLFFIAFSFSSAFAQTSDSLNVVPNPFETETTIHFRLAASDTVSLRVYDRWGQTVETFFQKTFLQAGAYDVTLRGDNLMSGMYVVRLDIGADKIISRSVVKLGDPTGIEDNKLTKKVLLFPNPTNGPLTIQMNGLKTFVVDDINGKRVKFITTEQQSISLSGLSAGQYQITVLDQQNKRVTTQKILKTE